MITREEYTTARHAELKVPALDADIKFLLQTEKIITIGVQNGVGAFNSISLPHEEDEDKKFQLTLIAMISEHLEAKRIKYADLFASYIKE